MGLPSVMCVFSVIVQVLETMFELFFMSMSVHITLCKYRLYYYYCLFVTINTMYNNSSVPKWKFFKHKKTVT